VKVLLDEHISPHVARALRDRGYDVIAVAERQELRGADDRQVLLAAEAEGRVTVTADIRDFSRLGFDRLPNRRWHAGIVLASPTTFPLSDAAFGTLVRALEHLMAEKAVVDVSGEVIWLSRAPEDVPDA
jgi:nucleoside-diphosphate-sugar epimerase